MQLQFDARFRRDLIVLALPIAGQVFLEFSVNFIDTLMIGRLGEAEIAGVGVANQIFFVVSLFFFGIASGIGVFVAQYWGKRDVTNIRHVQGVAVALALGTALVTASLAISAPRWIIGLFTADQAVIASGAAYLRIVAVSYPLTALIATYSSVVRSCGESGLPFRATIVGFCINVVLNSVLIFGLFGLPALGVRGAAIGTLIARAIELTVLLRSTYARGLPAAARLQQMFRWPDRLFGRVMTTAGPVIANEVAWVIGVTMYSVVFGRIGTEAFAARHIADTVFRLTLVLFIGVGNASYVMIGNTIGSGDRERARAMAWQFQILAPSAAIVAGAILAIAAPYVSVVFAVSDLTAQYATTFLFIIAATFPFKAITLVQMVGVFRGGGDTRFALLVDLLGVWGVGVPLTFLTGLVLRWPVGVVFFISGSEEIVKAVVGVIRTHSGRWLNDLTTAETAATAGAADVPGPTATDPAYLSAAASAGPATVGELPHTDDQSS